MPQLIASMKTHVEFRSAAFPPYEGEEDEINPGIYGKRVAEFLIRGLRTKGFQAREPVAEDWGWLVPIENDGFPLWIGCGHQDEKSDGFLSFIEPHQPKIRRFMFFGTIDTTARVTALQRAIDELHSDNATVTDKQWWSHDEFNGRLE
jgi:hypothetical protein